MKRLFILFVMLPFLGLGQERGIQFEHGITFAQVREKAKKENKYIFMDCYTTWCAPCRQMSAEVFTQAKVGEFFNANFVNVKVQFDQTEKDNQEVKRWYAEAKAINAQYKITAFPTFLIFSPGGELVHRIVGSYEAAAFIATAKVALNPATQYYTMLKATAGGSADPAKLRQLAIAAQVAKDDENARKFSDAYWATQKDLFSKENLGIMMRFANSSSSKGFQLVLNNAKKVDSVMGAGRANELLSSVIVREELNPAYGQAGLNIDSLVVATEAKYPGVDISKPASMVKVLFYQVNKDWNKFQRELLAYMEKNKGEMTAAALNYFARTVLDNCPSAEGLAAALSWSMESIERAEKTGEQKAIYLDTYKRLKIKLAEQEKITKGE